MTTLDASLPTDSRDKLQYYYDYTPLRKIITPVAEAVFRLFGEIHFEGQQNFPAAGPVVLAANHLTNFDVFPMQFSIKRPIFFMSKEELFKNPVLSFSVRQFGAFPVRRGAKDEWALQHSLKVLQHGQVMGIFPEGTRSKGRGLQPGKTGAARLAIAASCPVIPMAVIGTEKMFKHGLRRTPVTIRIGEPILPHADESPVDLTDRIMYHLAELLPPHLRGVYAVHAKGFPD